jgi:AbrB family looped-hinge helix DNA binding protein
MDNLIVSGRGQITLPAKLRKRLGIEPGGILIAEEKDGILVLRPAMVMPVEIYSDEDITRWMQEDTFKNENERKEFDRKLRALAKRAGKKGSRARKAA